MNRLWPILACLWLAGPACAETLFGYVGVACGVDDPFDDTAKTDYSDEVAGWTNANHLCLTGDPADWPDLIRQADKLWRPILSVEPAFDLQGDGPAGAASQVIWAAVRSAISDSGVDASRIVFYLVDEPKLRGIDPDRIETAAAIIRRDYPQSDVMVIEAYHAEGPPAPAASVTLWGFDAYTVPDPLREPLYVGYLAAIRARLGPGQRLVLVLDANHTPSHSAAGLAPADMADVARAYGRLAATIPDLGAMIGYTWVGGIDGPDERGVRDMPTEVLTAHRDLARAILGQ